jgi:phospholipase C
MRQVRVLVLVAVLAAVVACSGAVEPPPAAAGPGPVCGWRDSPPATYEHVVWIVLENHSYDDLIGTPGSPVATASPYLNRLAASCGTATNSWSVTHPSLPNYLAMVSGSTGGVTKSCIPARCPQRRRTLFEQVRAHGGSWRVLAESMPGDCRRTDAYPYVVRHNPATYFPAMGATCRRFDRPMGTPTHGRLADLVRTGRLPTFLLLVPNQCHNTHDCDIAAGDTWLSEVVPLIVGGPDYRAGRTVVVVTWDEGKDGYGGQDCRVIADPTCHLATVVISPTTPAGTRSSTRFDHYSLLETTERLLGIRTYLGHAGDRRTTSMRAAFRL